MKIKAMQINGTGGGRDNVEALKRNAVIPSAEHASFYDGTINLVLQCGWCFSATADSPLSGKVNGAIHYLTPISLFRPGRQESNQGYIVRNADHPVEFDNVIEVVTEYLDDLKPKEHFEVEGRFRRAS